MVFIGSNQCFEIRRSTAALKNQQVQRWRLTTGQYRQAGVSLSAMMGLMIEQMQQNI